MTEYYRSATALIVRLTLAISIFINGTTALSIETVVNDTTSISCFTNAPIDVQWHHTLLKGPSNYVYAGGQFYWPYKGRFKLDNPKQGVYILIIPETTPDDAGLYECGEDQTSARFGLTSLIVLESDPECTSDMKRDGFVGQNNCNIQQENMTFTCAVSYTGNTHPHLMWRLLSKNHTLSDSVCLSQSKRRICSITLRADLELDGSFLICETTGSRYNCTSEIIKVQYLFVAEFDDAKKMVYENVSCEVRSNLHIRYNWAMKQDGENVFLSTDKTIVAQKPGLHLCEVEYSIRNITCSTLSANISIIQGENDSAAGIYLSMIIVTIVIILVLFAIVAAVAVHRKRPRKVRTDSGKVGTEHTKNGNSEAKPLNQGECDDSITHMCSVDVDYIEEELLRNPGDFHSWTISQNGGDGWVPKSDERFGSCLASSYEWCEKSQLIDLKALGYSDRFLDSAPEILISDCYRGRSDCGSYYQLVVELKDASHRVLQEPFEFKDEPNAAWMTVTKRFTNYGKGLRFVLFQHSGKDNNWWKGNYGARVAGSSVIFLFPTVQHTIESSKSSHTSTLSSYESSNTKQAIRNFISLWNLSTIDLWTAVETAISELNRKFKENVLQSEFKNVPQIRKLRFDLQPVSDDSACIAVLMGDKTCASIIVPIGRQFGAHQFKVLLTRSFEFSEAMEFRRNDGRITVSEDSRIFKKDTRDTSWIVLLNGSNAKMIGICHCLKKEQGT